MEATEAAEIISELNEEKEEAEVEARFRNRAALQIAIVAAILAIGGLGGEKSRDEMVASNIKASDAWSFYQAKNVRQTMYQLAADQLKGTLATAPGSAGPDGAARLRKYQSTVTRYEDEPDPKARGDETKGEGKKQLRARAESYEKAFEEASARNESFDWAETALQLAVVLGSVAILALNRWILYASGILGVLGALLVVNGFLMLVPVG
ncbi:MAG TPA: DUF4337 domain-containing protein [Allosphingosinicella sp.]|nr:DUF4337 domain-containing protein [Allosphingosinicella sp.]